MTLCSILGQSQDWEVSPLLALPPDPLFGGKSEEVLKNPSKDGLMEVFSP